MFTLLAFALAILFGALPLPDASAATGVRAFYGGEGTTGGKFGRPGSTAFQTGVAGIAINQAGTGGAGQGNVYVVDGVNDRVQQFTASGEFVRAFGVDVGGPGVDVCTEAAGCQAGKPSEEAGGMSNPEGLAIDQATGNVFVSDYGNRRIDVFSAIGVFEGAFGWSVDAEAPAETLQFCTSATACQSGSEGAGAGQFARRTNESIGGLAISPANGHLLIASAANRRIDEFAPVMIGGLITGVTFVRGSGWGAATGANEFQICTTTCHAPGSAVGTALGQFGESSPGGLAVDSSGTIFAPDSGSGRARVMTIGSTGTPLGLFAPGSFSSGRAPHAGIAFEAAEGSLLVTRGSEELAEFNPAGDEVESYLGGLGLNTVNSFVAVDEASGVIYVTEPGRLGFVTLGEIVPPTASLEPVTKFAQGPTGVSAVLEGHVNPEGLETGYHFEYSRDGAHWTRIPPADLFLPSDSVDHEVEPQTATGLEGLTEYGLRLVASKILKSGSATAEATFQTPAAPPAVSVSSMTNVTDTSAVLQGSINPQNQATTYHFECVTEAQFAKSGFADSLSVPGGDEPVVDGGESVGVLEKVEGLAPSTAYRCRLAAANPAGPVFGAEASFTTFQPGSVGLPDGRAYEQVSPVQKNGSNAQGEADAVQAAAEGEGITFFSNGGIPGGEGSQEFPVYLASRAADGSGWSTQGLLPPASTGAAPFGKLIGWDEELVDAYDVNGFAGGSPTLYQRDSATRDLRVLATGSNPTKKAPFAFAAQANDGSLVLFEDAVNQLTPDAVAGTSNVYLFNRVSGELSLASVLNNGKAPAEGAFAGPYRWFGNPTTAAGGAASLYYTQAEHVLSTGAGAVYFTAKGTGQMYVRVNPLARQSNLSKGACTQPERACTIQVSAPAEGVVDANGERPAAFIGATPDGGKAFFLSAGKLTSDATTGPTDGGLDLYRYEMSSGKLSDLTVDSGSANGAEVKGVVGMSEDGSYVYFVANGVLAAGAAPGTCVGNGETVRGICNLYLWHEGSIILIAPLIATLPEGAGGKAQEEDLMDWAPTALRVGTNASEATARVSADGRVVLFRSRLRLTNYDNQGVSEFYRDALGEGLVCVSCSPTGAAPTGQPSLQQFPIRLTGPKLPQGVLTRNLSANGNRIFFNTSDQLVASDTNGVRDVYEWEASGEGSCRSQSENGGCLYLISTGSSPQPSSFADASRNGSEIFFFTDQPLVTQDTDDLTDVYDARIGGGIAAQNEVESSCYEEVGCRPPPSGASAGRSPASPVTGGNIKPPPTRPRCKKGQRRAKHHGKTVCVRVKRHHAHHRHKAKAPHGKGGKAGRHAHGRLD